MLEPQSRTLLLDVLKPPPDCSLDYALGTTFTLDLVALLVAPLAFALLDRSGPDGKLSADPVALLEALRRNADRFAIFCQAGRISVPKPDRLLLSYLEGNVIGVTAPRGGVFHPKVWALRFVAEGAPVKYRFICASRNLTFDRSWDTVAVLEGDLVDRKTAYSRNHPLGDFVAALPDLAVGAVSEAVRHRVDQFQRELRRVEFSPPEDFEGYDFYPMGIGRYKDFLSGERIDRLLVVSPFVSQGGLEKLVEATDDEVQLVSRLEELQALPQLALEGIAHVSVFSDEQAKEESTEEDLPEASSAASLEPEAEPELSGLHAKLYVADQGWKAVIWTGSANATDAAFNRNVEFMLALSGKKGNAGVDALLATDANQPGFRSFLTDYISGTGPTEVDAAKRELEQELDAANILLSTAKLRVNVCQEDGEKAWRLELVGTKSIVETLPEDLNIRAWPITCRFEAVAKSVDLKSGGETWAVFTPLTFEALTSFVAFKLTLARANAAASVQFVLNLPAEGFPKDRANRLLLRLLDNRDAVMRYIQLLLETGKRGPEGDLGVFGHPATGTGSGAAAEQMEPLLEPLVSAMHRDPQKLDEVARLVDDLKAAGAGSRELPAGFEEIWTPIWEARQKSRNAKRSS
jgi:hypothetical protein